MGSFRKNTKPGCQSRRPGGFFNLISAPATPPLTGDRDQPDGPCGKAIGSERELIHPPCQMSENDVVILRGASLASRRGRRRSR